MIIGNQAVRPEFKEFSDMLREQIHLCIEALLRIPFEADLSENDLLDRLYSEFFKKPLGNYSDSQVRSELTCSKSKMLMRYPTRIVNRSAQPGDPESKEALAFSPEVFEYDEAVTLVPQPEPFYGVSYCSGRYYDDGEHDYENTLLRPLLNSPYHHPDVDFHLKEDKSLLERSFLAIERPSRYVQTYRGKSLLKELFLILQEKDPGKLVAFLNRNPHLFWGTFFGSKTSLLSAAFRFPHPEMMQLLLSYQLKINVVQALAKLFSGKNKDTFWKSLRQDYQAESRSKFPAVIQFYEQAIEKVVKQITCDQILSPDDVGLSVLSLACGMNKPKRSSDRESFKGLSEIPGADPKTVRCILWVLGDKAPVYLKSADRWTSPFLRTCRHQSVEILALILDLLKNDIDDVLFCHTNGYSCDPLDVCLTRGYDFAKLLIDVLSTPARRAAFFASYDQSSFHPLEQAIEQEDPRSVALLLEAMGPEKAKAVLLSRRYSDQDSDRHGLLHYAASGAAGTDFTGNLTNVELLWKALDDKAAEAALQYTKDGNVIEHAIQHRAPVEVIAFLLKKLSGNAPKAILPTNHAYSRALLNAFTYFLRSNNNTKDPTEILSSLLKVLGNTAADLLMAEWEDENRAEVKENKGSGKTNYLLSMLKSDLGFWCDDDSPKPPYCSREQVDEMRASLATLLFNVVGPQRAEHLILKTDPKNGMNALAYACCDWVGYIPNIKATGYEYSGYQTVKVFLNALSPSGKKAVYQDLQKYFPLLLSPLKIGGRDALSPAIKLARADKIFQAFVECFPSKSKEITQLYQEMRTDLVWTVKEGEPNSLMAVQSKYQKNDWDPFSSKQFASLDEYRALQSKALLDAVGNKAPSLIMDLLTKNANALHHVCRDSGPKTLTVILSALNAAYLEKAKDQLATYLNAMLIGLRLDNLDLMELPERFAICQAKLDVLALHLRLNRKAIGKQFEQIFLQRLYARDKNGLTILQQVLKHDLSRKTHRMSVRLLREQDQKKINALKLLFSCYGEKDTQYIILSNEEKQTPTQQEKHSVLSLLCLSASTESEWNRPAVVKCILGALNEQSKVALGNNLQHYFNLLVGNPCPRAKAIYQDILRCLNIKEGPWLDPELLNRLEPVVDAPAQGQLPGKRKRQEFGDPRTEPPKKLNANAKEFRPLAGLAQGVIPQAPSTPNQPPLSMDHTMERPRLMMPQPPAQVDQLLLPHPSPIEYSPSLMQQPQGERLSLPHPSQMGQPSILMAQLPTLQAPFPIQMPSQQPSPMVEGQRMETMLSNDRLQLPPAVADNRYVGAGIGVSPQREPAGHHDPSLHPPGRTYFSEPKP